MTFTDALSAVSQQSSTGVLMEPNATLDQHGRIMWISPTARIGRGHSVCVNCGHDMPRCWDVICCLCNKAFCYKCVQTFRGYWYCNDDLRSVR